MAKGDGLQNRYTWVRIPPPPLVSLNFSSRHKFYLNVSIYPVAKQIKRRYSTLFSLAFRSAMCIIIINSAKGEYERDEGVQFFRSILAL